MSVFIGCGHHGVGNLQKLGPLPGAKHARLAQESSKLTEDPGKGSVGAQVLPHANEVSKPTDSSVYAHLAAAATLLPSTSHKRISFLALSSQKHTKKRILERYFGLAKLTHIKVSTVGTS